MRMTHESVTHSLRHWGFRAGLAATAACTLLLASTTTAQAETIYYQELLTAEQLTDAPDARVQLSSLDPFDLAELLADGSYVGDGIGDGYLAGLSSHVSYTHQAPVESMGNLISATLSVALYDDLIGEPWHFTEQATIEVDDQFWQGQSFLLKTFVSGAVSALFFETDGSLNVTVISAGGDFNLMASLLELTYEGSIGPQGNVAPDSDAVPEPGALALFYAGALVFVGRRGRWTGR